MEPQEQNQYIRKRISHKTSPKISPVTSPRISPLNSPVNPKPLGCGKDGTEGIAWLNSFVTGMANSHIIDNVTTKKHFERLAVIIYDVTD